MLELLLRDANDGRSIDMELLDKTRDVMETIHSTMYSTIVLDEQNSELNITNLSTDERTSDASINSLESSIFLERSKSIDTDSSNAESNYSTTTRFTMVDNYDAINVHNKTSLFYSSITSIEDIISLEDIINDTFIVETTNTTHSTLIETQPI